MDTCLRSSLWSGGGQTDYLSPYLFILNVELLSSAMKIINGVNKNNSASIANSNIDNTQSH